VTTTDKASHTVQYGLITALGPPATAEILSEETGRTISYIDISEEDARKGMKKMGMGDWFIQNAMELYNIYRARYASQTTAIVEQITGRKSIFHQLVKKFCISIIWTLGSQINIMEYSQWNCIYLSTLVISTLAIDYLYKIRKYFIVIK